MSKKFYWLLLIFIVLGLNQLEARSYKIGQIHFLKVSFHGDEDLKNIIQSRKEGRFDPRYVKLDKILIINYYKKNGFLDVAVRDSLIRSVSRRKVDIFYTIEEGQRYYYGGVRFNGNKDLPASTLADAFAHLELYRPFDESLVSEGEQKIENLYYNSGKPFADIKVNYLYEQDSLIVVLLHIDEKQTVYIRNIQYQGLKLVQKFIIRRELEIHKGDRYSRARMEQSQKNLYGTGLFRYVRFEIEPIADDPSQVILKITVREKDPRWIGFHLGVTHEQETYYGNKLEFSLQGGHRNLFGTGRSISLHITPSLIWDISERKLRNPDNKISLRFVEPWILATRTPGTFNLAYEQFRPLHSGHFDLWRAKFDVRRKITKYLEFTTSLDAKLIKNISSGKIDSLLALKVQANRSNVYSLIFYGKRDNRKNLFNPQNSSYTDLSISYSYSRGYNRLHRLETNNYFKITSSWQRYQPWRPKISTLKRWHFTLATRIKAGGLIEPWGPKIIPLNDLFFAGGATSVRGYQEQLLGKAALKDAQGHIIQAAGGKLLFLTNAEIRMPLFWIVVLETFVDGGYVWPEIKDFRPWDVKFTTGLGLVLLSPLGPIRLDYGYKLIPTAEDATRYAWHIGIYFAF